MKYLVKFEGQLLDTRNSDRTYTHAVIAVKADGTGCKGAMAFCGRPDLAQKEVNKLTVANARVPSWAGFTFQAVPVEVDAVAQAAKKPMTHRLVYTFPHDGHKMNLKSYTSEKLAQKALDRVCGDRRASYHVEAIPQVVA